MLDEIVKYIGAALGAGLLALVGYVGKQVVNYVISNHLEKLAVQAVNFAEDAYAEFDGADKLEAASKWVSKRLRKFHIKIDADDIEEAVQSAYTRFKKQLHEKVKEDDEVQDLADLYEEPEDDAGDDHGEEDEEDSDEEESD